MNELTNEDIIMNINKLHFDGNNVFPNLFESKTTINLNFIRINISYNNSTESLSFYKPEKEENSNINNDLITQFENKYFSAINNGIDVTKWEKIINNNNIEGIAKVFTNHGTVYVGFLKFDMNLINLIKTELTDSEISFSFDMENLPNYTKWNNETSLIKPSTYLINNIFPSCKERQIFIGNKSKYYDTYCGFHFISNPNNEIITWDALKNHKNDSDEIEIFAEPGSIIIWASFITDEYRKMIKNLLLDIENIYEKEKIFNKIENDNSIYCFTDCNENINKEYDFNLFCKYLDYFQEYFVKCELDLGLNFDLYI